MLESGMAKGKVNWTVVSLGLAKMILHDREERRKLLGSMLMVALGQMAVGLWVVNDWLMESPIRFLLWWGACAVVTFVVLLFALYDILAVIREERDKTFRNKD